MGVGNAEIDSCCSPSRFYSHSLRSFHSGSSVRVGFSRRVDAASRRSTVADMRSHRKIRIVFFMRELLSERSEREAKYGDVVVLAELLCGFGDGAGGLGANEIGRAHV